MNLSLLLPYRDGTNRSFLNEVIQTVEGLRGLCRRAAASCINPHDSVGALEQCWDLRAYYVQRLTAAGRGEDLGFPGGDSL